jgi:RecB family exonuclease
VLLEEKGKLVLQAPVFTLTGRPDRIDQLPDGQLAVFDYKTGTPPSKAEQAHFDKQLILLSIMAEEGAFRGIPPASVAKAAFVSLGTTFKLVDAEVTTENLTAHRAGLRQLLGEYLSPGQGFIARRAAKKDADRSDYDHLSRRGEWQVTDPVETVLVGDHDG